MFEAIMALAGLVLLTIASNIVFPWLGHTVVKALTFGKLDLGWRSDDEGWFVTMWVGIGFVLLVAGLIVQVVHR